MGEMNKLPHNVIELYHGNGRLRNDTGKKVLVTSVGGKSYPDNTHKRTLEKVKGTVVWGPCQLWYVAQQKVRIKNAGKRPHRREYTLKPNKFITEPYWCVRLDGYNLEIYFQESELKFI